MKRIYWQKNGDIAPAKSTRRFIADGNLLCTGIRLKYYKLGHILRMKSLRLGLKPVML